MVMKPRAKRKTTARVVFYLLPEEKTALDTLVKGNALSLTGYLRRLTLRALRKQARTGSPVVTP